MWEDDELLASKSFDSRDSASTNITETFGDLVEPEDGLYRLAFSKGPVYSETRSLPVTRVIESATTIKPASGIEKGLTQEIANALDIAGQINTIAGNVDPTSATEFLGAAIDVAATTTLMVDLIDDALDSPDQLQIRMVNLIDNGSGSPSQIQTKLDVRKILPNDSAAFVESKAGQFNRVAYVDENAKPAVLELLDFDDVSDPDSLGEYFMNTAVAPEWNDPSTALVFGDADEGSVYKITSRLYEDNWSEFCRLYRDRDVSLRGQNGFVHSDYTIKSTSNDETTSVHWKVSCPEEGRVAFSAPSPRAALLGAELDSVHWSPLQLIGTDRWVFRVIGSGPGTTPSQYLQGARSLSLKHNITRWSRFSIHVVGKSDPIIQLDTAVTIRIATRDVCLSSGTDETALGRNVIASNPCLGEQTQWVFERSDSEAYEFAYRIRLQDDTIAPLYLTNDPDSERITLSTCLENDERCFWYVDKSFNSSAKETMFLRSADPSFFALTTDLINWPEESKYRQYGPPPEGRESHVDLLSEAEVTAERCERDMNQPYCQWIVFAD